MNLPRGNQQLISLILPREGANNDQGSIHQLVGHEKNDLNLSLVELAGYFAAESDNCHFSILSKCHWQQLQSYLTDFKGWRECFVVFLMQFSDVQCPNQEQGSRSRIKVMIDLDSGDRVTGQVHGVRKQTYRENQARAIPL